MSWAANHINHSSATLRVGNVSYSGIRKSVIACSYSRRSLKFPLSQILGVLIIVPIVELVVLGSYCSAPRSARFLRVSSGHQVSMFASRVRFQSLRPAMTGSSSVALGRPLLPFFCNCFFYAMASVTSRTEGSESLVCARRFGVLRVLHCIQRVGIRVGVEHLSNSTVEFCAIVVS
jgi:hypothetical protein